MRPGVGDWAAVAAAVYVLVVVVAAESELVVGVAAVVELVVVRVASFVVHSGVEEVVVDFVAVALQRCCVPLPFACV